MLGDVRVAEIGMVVLAPKMQLQYKFAAADEPLIDGSAMCALAAEELPVPATARFNVPDSD